MSRKLSALWVWILLAIAFQGCVSVHAVSVESKISDFRVPRARDEVFDAAVAVGQRMNLDVPVLEKESGFLRFEYANVSAVQLDAYCQYPYANDKDGRAFETFKDWADRAALSGIVQLVLVMSVDGPSSTNVTVRARCKVVASGDSRPKGYTNVFANECNSLGTLEKEFVDGIESRLGVR